MIDYDPKTVEKKWQQKWAGDRLYETPDQSPKPKYYCLDMFPYPSGEGLHVGHFKGYAASDVISRSLRMKGYNVLHPMGWDAFGLPAENYAVKTGIHPKITTEKAIAKIRQQMKIVGLSYDWSREINTTDPSYYCWTQWIFLQLFKKGLAYQAEAPINWCPSCKTGLANEEVVAGRCERCGAQVNKKNLRQWLLKITAYADRLLADLDNLDWPEHIKTMQRNWIGKSVGAEVEFEVEGTKEKISVFTTRLDTIFSAAFMVLAPEHLMIKKITPQENKSKVANYIDRTLKKSDIERTELLREKAGVSTGAYAVNPVNGDRLPVWIADFVLASYGSGAVFGDANDQRDFEFAEKYKIPLKVSIRPKDDRLWQKVRDLRECFVGDGILVNSGQFDGLSSLKARKKILEWLAKSGQAKKAVNYKLRDWLFSRQRYWGEPIPIVHCQKCGAVPVAEKDLPVLLPKVKNFKPTGTGESPLATISEFVDTHCPKCAGIAKRETNTMPQWAGSCWYYLRFCDPKNSKSLVDSKKEKYWMKGGLVLRSSKSVGGVDWYIGGAEHAVLHLLYARFWHKFLYDLKIVSTPEPFFKLRDVGMVLGEGGIKMSKSRGNVVTSDDIVSKYGADTLRLYELFMGPFGDRITWNPKSIEGVNRFLYRFWRLIMEAGKRQTADLPAARLPDGQSRQGGMQQDENLEGSINRLVKKVSEDIEAMKFNTAIAAMMEFLNEANKNKAGLTLMQAKKFILLLSPFAPHITEELWFRINLASPRGLPARRLPALAGGRPRSRSAIRRDKHWSVHQQRWPVFDQAKLTENYVTIVVQVDGKLKSQLKMEAGSSKETIEAISKGSEHIKKYLKNIKVVKTIIVPDKLINFVTE